MENKKEEKDIDELHSDEFYNKSEICNVLIAFEKNLKLINETNKLLCMRTEIMKKSGCNEYNSQIFSQILTEFQMITHKAETIQNLLEKLSSFTEEIDLKKHSHVFKTSFHKKINLRLVPIEKLIEKPLEKAIDICAQQCSMKLNTNNKDLFNQIKSIKSCRVKIKRINLTQSAVNSVKQNMENSSLITPEDAKQNNIEDCLTSDSEVTVIKRKKRLFTSESEKTEFDNESRSSKEKDKIRKNIKISASSDSSDEASRTHNKQRRKIRKLIKTKNLEECTKEASLEEEHRRRRVEERQSMYNKIYSTTKNDEINELVLDFDETTKETILEVDRNLVKQLKPHQVNGVKFMWDACFESVNQCKQKIGSGCILAHCMGLGKTLQIVALSQTLLANSKKTGVERVLIISPLSTLSNWAHEFTYWIELTKEKELNIYDLSKYKDKNTRAFKLNEWLEEGGICILGYDMYRILSNKKSKGFSKKMKDIFYKSLVDPGPDLVVCDEGHLLKNEKTSLSQAVSKITTKRRIVLTGTPLQNNLKEYYCMIQFIKPNLLGTYKEYLNRFVNPITNGQYNNSTEHDIRLMRHRSHILHKMLEGCIQRRDYSVLAPYLPIKHEYVVFIILSEVQKKLYSFYMLKQRNIICESSNKGGKGAKLFGDFQTLQRIWTHPLNLRQNIKEKTTYDSDDSLKDFIDDSEETYASDSSFESSKWAEEINSHKTSSSCSESKTSDNIIESKPEDLDPEWWKQFIDDKNLGDLHISPKLLILMEIIKRCEFIGDKVLVFSQSLQSLDAIEYFLSLIDKKTKGIHIEENVGSFQGRWQLGFDYLRLDGSCSVEKREKMCRNFNDVSNSRLRLLLISTRAGSLGINLVAANRVVILDVSWNPSHDTQSIFRVYRFGQKKPCYIYRLISLGTMEQKVYDRQVTKQATAKRVIDEQQISRHYNQSDLQELYTFDLTPILQRETPKLPKDRLFAELLSDYKHLIYKYHEHDSLLENEESEILTEEERKAAWNEYEAEKNKPSLIHYTYGQTSGNLTSNKTFGFRNDVLLRLLNIKISQDHPHLNNLQRNQLVPIYLQRFSSEMHMGNPSMYKDLLTLNNSLELSTGLDANPLLYSNQYSSSVTSLFQQNGSLGFKANEVYEVD